LDEIKKVLPHKEKISLFLKVVHWGITGEEESLRESSDGRKTRRKKNAGLQGLNKVWDRE